MAQLIVYFSRRGENYVSGRIQPLSVGNTEVVARRLQVLTGADLFQLEPVHPYSDNYNQCIEQAQADQQAMELLRRVGLEDKADSYPNQLSGGQKQRIAIAGVLAMEPECIVLDEATAMLDPVGRREVLSAVHRLNREKGITVVLITHHMNEAEDADRVAVMDDGKVIMDGAPRQVFTQVERLRSMGLTVPDTVDLLDRLRKDGLDVPLTALTVEECADAILAAVSK